MAESADEIGPEEFSVAVVGGGLAGISAARSLVSQFGKESVVVLEAASRLGGRIQNVSGLAPWPVEIGPEFLHGANDSSSVKKIADEMGCVQRELSFHDASRPGLLHEMVDMVTEMPRTRSVRVSHALSMRSRRTCTGLVERNPLGTYMQGLVRSSRRGFLFYGLEVHSKHRIVIDGSDRYEEAPAMFNKKPCRRHVHTCRLLYNNVLEVDLKLGQLSGHHHKSCDDLQLSNARVLYSAAMVQCLCEVGRYFDHAYGGPDRTDVALFRRHSHNETDYYYLGDEGRLLSKEEAENNPDIQQVHAIFSALGDEDFENVQPDMSMAEYLRQKDANQRVMDLAKSLYGNDLGCSIESLGLHECIQEARHWIDGDTYLILDRPLSSIVDYMSHDLNVRLNWVVSKVERRPSGGLRLHSKDGRVVEADYMILTVPVTILQQGFISFDPPLPDLKLQAVNAIGMSTVVKVVLAFSQPFWPKDVFDVLCSGCFLPEVWMTEYPGSKDHNEKNDGVTSPHDQSPLGQCIVVGFIAGDEADALAQLPEAEIFRNALAQLDAMFGNPSCLEFLPRRPKILKFSHPPIINLQKENVSIQRNLTEDVENYSPERLVNPEQWKAVNSESPEKFLNTEREHYRITPEAQSWSNPLKLFTKTDLLNFYSDNCSSSSTPNPKSGINTGQKFFGRENADLLMDSSYNNSKHDRSCTTITPEASQGWQRRRRSSSSKGPASSYFEGGLVVNWAEHSFIRGGYSHPSVNARGARDVLAEPVDNRIFFAGEATNPFVNPCLQSAIDTGQRAAHQVIFTATKTSKL